MQIYKFGGASVKDAQSVRNVASILENTPHRDILIVISAMGKTTNALEEVVTNYFNEDKNALDESIQRVKDFHYQIISELFENKNHPIYWKIDGLFGEISSFLERNKSPKQKAKWIGRKPIAISPRISIRPLCTSLKVS